MKKRSTSQSAPTSRSLGKGGFFNLRIVIPLCIVLASFFPAYLATAQEAWAARYNSSRNLNDAGYDVAVDTSGNVYVTGFSVGGGTGADYATIKYNALGIQQWVVTYNGPGNGDDIAFAIDVDSSGNVYVTGYSAGSGTGYDCATIKYDASGTQKWVARYNGPINGNDYGSFIAIDASGNVYVTGQSAGSGSGRDYVTIKYNASGAQKWVARYNGPVNGDDSAQGIAVDGSGNVYVTGRSAGAGSGCYPACEDYATIKYNASGTQQWVARYNGTGDSDDVARDIAVDGSGNVYVTGWSTGLGSDYDYATIKYSASGMQQWVDRYNGPGNGGDFVEGIAVDSSGNIYVTGHSDGSGTGTDFATIKYLSCWPGCTE